ncbi:MAG: L-threonylcarbamoyladenylate synthase [Bacteroidia bacterium]
MRTEILALHPQNPQRRLLKKIVEALQEGELIIYPTDTVYAVGADSSHKGAYEKLCQLKNLSPHQARFSVFIPSLKEVGIYTTGLSTPAYKVLKKFTPGPYTFIVWASKEIPRHLHFRRTIGIRISSHILVQEIVGLLGRPLITTSLKREDMPWEDYPTRVEEMDLKSLGRVRYVIECDVCGREPSTVVDLTTDPPELLRQGLGPWA